MSKRKRFDPLDFTLEHGQLQVGTLASVGLTGKIGQQVPAGGQPIAGDIVQTSGTLALIPRFHAIGGVLGSLSSLEDVSRKNKNSNPFRR